MNEDYRRFVLQVLLNSRVHPDEYALLGRLEGEVARCNMLAISLTCRYYADSSGWRVDVMDGGRTPPMRGVLDSEPEWLANILVVGRVGGHIATWASGPGGATHTMWFRINEQNQLVEFVDWIKK